MAFPWGERIGLLVADVPWGALHAALNATGEGERFEVGPAIADWGTWYEEFPAPNTSTLLCGEYSSRSYVFSGHTIGPNDPDRIVALASATGGLVLGHWYDDTTGTGATIAAQGDRLLRYVVDGWVTDSHIEGDPLPGESEEPSSLDFDRVLAALGFEVDAWLAEGAKWEVTWTSLDLDRDAAAIARLYRGPVRMRSMWVDEAALDELDGQPDELPPVTEPPR